MLLTKGVEKSDHFIVRYQDNRIDIDDVEKIHEFSLHHLKYRLTSDSKAFWLLTIKWSDFLVFSTPFYRKYICVGGEFGGKFFFPLNLAAFA